MKQVAARGFAAVALATAALFGADAHAAMVVQDIEFDPDDGTLTTDVDGMVHDSYVSEPIGILSALLPGDTLRLNVDFVDGGTGLGQTIVLEQQGLGVPWPTTFGTVTNPGMHVFGPSLILVGNVTPLGASAVVTPALAGSSDPLSADFTGATGDATCAANVCSFPVIFADMIEGDNAVVMSGFTVDFTLNLPQETIFNVFEFRLMAPGASITQVPEPATGALLLVALAAAGLSALPRRPGR